MGVNCKDKLRVIFLANKIWWVYDKLSYKPTELLLNKLDDEICFKQITELITIVTGNPFNICLFSLNFELASITFVEELLPIPIEIQSFNPYSKLSLTWEKSKPYKL